MMATVGRVAAGQGRRRRTMGTREPHPGRSRRQHASRFHGWKWRVRGREAGLRPGSGQRGGGGGGGLTGGAGGGSDRCVDKGVFRIGGNAAGGGGAGSSAARQDQHDGRDLRRWLCLRWEGQQRAEPNGHPTVPRAPRQAVYHRVPGLRVARLRHTSHAVSDLTLAEERPLTGATPVTITGTNFLDRGQGGLRHHERRASPCIHRHPSPLPHPPVPPARST